MKRIVVIAVTAACSDAGRVAKLEKRVEELEVLLGRSGSTADAGVDNDRAPVDRAFFFETIQDINRDVAGLREGLLHAGVIDDKDKNVSHWWCLGGDAACYRSEAGCQHMATLIAGAGGNKSSCVASRVAYCDRRSRACVRNLDRCRKLAATQGSVDEDTWDCLGVE